MSLESFPAPTTVFRVGMASLGAPLFDVAMPPDLDAVAPTGLPVPDPVFLLQQRVAVLEQQVASLLLPPPPTWRARLMTWWHQQIAWCQTWWRR